jgi:hypothetical protein
MKGNKGLFVEETEDPYRIEGLSHIEEKSAC